MEGSQEPRGRVTSTWPDGAHEAWSSSMFSRSHPRCSVRGFQLLSRTRGRSNGREIFSLPHTSGDMLGVAVSLVI